MPNKIKDILEFTEIKYHKIILTSRGTGTINSKQLNALKQTINKIIKKKGKLIINIFPNIPITKKSVTSRMGKGKGNPYLWIFKVSKGIALCEIEVEKKMLGINALNYAKLKLPFKSKIVVN